MTEKRGCSDDGTRGQRHLEPDLYGEDSKLRRNQSCEGLVKSGRARKSACRSTKVGGNWAGSKHLPAARVATAEGRKGRTAGGTLEEERKSQTAQPTGSGMGFILNVTESH